MGKKKKTSGDSASESQSQDGSSVADSELQVGSKVEIFGLQGAPELNGRQGCIIKFVEETQRFGVRLEGDDSMKSVKPANLRRVGDVDADMEDEAFDPRAALEKRCSEVVARLKQVEDDKERVALQKELQDIVRTLRSAAEMAAQQQAQFMPPMPEAKAKAKSPQPTHMAAPPVLTPPGASMPMASVLQPPPQPREQHHNVTTMSSANPLPQASSPLLQQQILQQQLQQQQLLQQQQQQHQQQPKPQMPRRDVLPSTMMPNKASDNPLMFNRIMPEASLFNKPSPGWPASAVAPPKPGTPLAPPKKTPPVYSDEHEYPDPSRAHRYAKVAIGGVVVGLILAMVDLFPATWWVWSFLLVHLVGVIFLTDYAGEIVLAALWGTFGLHSGVALAEMLLWIFGRDGDDSVGPWSIVVAFGSFLYMQNFWMETVTLPPDYITSISFFFPMFPAYNAAVALSCLEMFVEWRYFPEYKVWPGVVLLGSVMMFVGQGLIILACRTSERNFWASCRNMPEEEEKPEDFVGLEIPDRRIVQEGPFRWERHPAYLGAMMWGVGCEVVLCNPVMLCIVGFVLWASLLYVTLEEEQDLYDEFKGDYAQYASLTMSWIPMFDSFLENAAFQREMSDNCEGENGENEEIDEEEEEEIGEEDDVRSEDDLLPTWEGVPKGGALWNRQFREPWLLG
mmetsp:Transcript_74011/g.176157  ORF Transcript_74011/g.176157 Transcript_74011/m.176157 type:complete len:679 (+) Transcript_74011:122-2158(+)